MLRPQNRVIARLRVRELKDHLTSLEVRDHSPLITASRHHKVGVRKAPANRGDSTVMDVLESGNRVVSLSQVPHIETWVLIIVICNHKLSSKLRIPHHTSSFSTDRCLC